MTYSYLFQGPKFRPLDTDGNLMPGAYIQFYLTQTTTDTDTYADADLSTPNDNPVVADAAGEFGVIYLNPSITYRAILYDADDNKIWDIDPYAPPRDFVPGTVVLFYGNATARDAAYPPATWQVMDGNNGTFDLRDRFIRMAGATYAAGDTGGSASPTTSSSGAHDHGAATGAHTLALSEIPSHHHGIWVDTSGGTTYAIAANVSSAHSFAGWAPSTSESFEDDFGDGQQAIEDVGGGGSHTHTISSDGAHTHSVSVDPPYGCLWALMRRNV